MFSMFRAWRRAAVVAVIGGAAIAAQLTAVVPAQAAAPTVTIAAASKIKPVTGDVYVVYLGGSYGNATIHGTITGAAAGEVATLYAQPFPFTKAAAPVRSVTLSAAGTRTYSFTVTPTLATRYKVMLFAKTTPLATSPIKFVYVVSGGSVTGGARCGRPVCKETSTSTRSCPARPSASRCASTSIPTSASTSHRSSNLRRRRGFT